MPSLKPSDNSPSLIEAVAEEGDTAKQEVEEEEDFNIQKKKKKSQEELYY